MVRPVGAVPDLDVVVHAGDDDVRRKVLHGLRRAA